MTQPTYYVLADSKGQITGNGYTPDGTLPSGAVACTQAQAQDCQAWQVVGGALVAASSQQLAAQQAARAVVAAFAAGLTISCTSTPALNGVYAVDQAAQARVNAIETFVLKNGAFPGSSGTSLAYPQMNGTMVVFPSLPIWGEFATAVANYVADLDLYAAGSVGSLPASSVTIA